ncbi:MAG: AEC family transporter [Denitrobacterium detoxificans]|nr:AEC family transporter [Denitrobacterium detoxificans]
MVWSRARADMPYHCPMLSLTLAWNIFTLFIIMAMGFALVKTGIAKPEHSHGVSLLSLYIVSPCMIISAFQVELTDDLRSGFMLSCLAAVIVQASYNLVCFLLKRPLGLTAVERASVTYSNAGNLIIPLVVSLLGSEWVIYCTPFIFVQNAFLWSVGKSTLQGKTTVDWRQIVLSPNMIATYVGGLLFLLQIELPGPLGNAVSSVGSMIGPLAMLLTGLIMGGIKASDLVRFRRLPIPVLLRLVALPLLALGAMKLLLLANLAPDASNILLITLLGAAAPAASTVNQMANIYGNDAGYASIINVVTTLLCIITMPLVVAVYLL